MPAFPTFTGDDGSVSSRDHIFKLSNHCVAYEDNPNYKFRLFGNSLVGQASQWYSLLPLNFIANWGQEIAFHEQFYRIEPEMTINDLVEVKQYDHESTENFMMRIGAPIRDQKIIINDERFVPMKPPKYQSYSFDLAKAPEIYEELVQARVILPDNTKKMPKPEELRGKKYCKLHYTFNHSIANYVQFRDWIQDLIVKGKLLLDKPQTSMMVDTNPFPEAPINTINLIWVKKPGSSFIAEEKGDISHVAPIPPHQ
ncbi:unnamed protein product [Malus baccata var. baccata]